VKADFIEDPLTKARDISVTTEQGVVHLSGIVDSQEQSDEAVRIANSIPGVRSFDNGCSRNHLNEWGEINQIQPYLLPLIVPFKRLEKRDHRGRALIGS